MKKGTLSLSLYIYIKWIYIYILCENYKKQIHWIYPFDREHNEYELLRSFMLIVLFSIWIIGWNTLWKRSLWGQRGRFTISLMNKIVYRCHGNHYHNRSFSVYRHYFKKNAFPVFTLISLPVEMISHISSWMWTIWILMNIVRLFQRLRICLYKINRNFFC